MNVARLYRVTGRVQGVWFRESTRQQAQRLGLTGHAVNLPDGSVEVLACGTTGSLSQLESWLHQGPPLAEVTAVTARPFEGTCPDEFTTGWSGTAA